MDKKTVIRLLEAGDYAGLESRAESDPQAVFRRLVSLAYDKNELICWRAIEAVGRVSGAVNRTKPEVARNLAQRLLWMMRDESGNNPGSAPELLGEIVVNSPHAFADIAPIIGSFEDELMLRRGVLRALWRIAGVNPELVDVREAALREYLADADPLIRAYAVLLAGAKRMKGLRPELEAMRQDTAEAVIYVQGEFRQQQVGELAAREILHLGGKE